MSSNAGYQKHLLKKIGQRCIQVTYGANRENTIVLAIWFANGEALDPLVIFKGKNLHSTWPGNESLRETWFGVSKSEWMTTAIFHAWFGKLLKKVLPRLLSLLNLQWRKIYLLLSYLLIALMYYNLPTWLVISHQKVTMKSTSLILCTILTTKVNKPAFCNLIAGTWRKDMNK